MTGLWFLLVAASSSVVRTEMGAVRTELMAVVRAETDALKKEMGDKLDSLITLGNTLAAVQSQMGQLNRELDRPHTYRRGVRRERRMEAPPRPT